ncbi:MAG: ABC transporter ATP-binding protein [Lachnospiraceae bacterium]|nr:ABC transporter ATP-binding protein [Lachnospiraceae bacterium]
MADILLNMKNIVREFETGGETLRILKGVDLEVERGEFLAIVGPSGSGKSTLMNIIGLLDVATSGTYIMDGRNIQDLGEDQLAILRNQEIGFVFQQYFLLPRLTARENVMIPMFYANMPEKDQLEKSEELLEKVGLKDRMDFYPKQLSGGLQQRVAIARALGTDPSLLLADEPTGALDQRTGKQIIELFQKLNDEGTTIVMITHDAKVASNAKKILKILDGNISEGDTADA